MGFPNLDYKQSEDDNPEITVVIVTYPRTLSQTQFTEAPQTWELIFFFTLTLQKRRRKTQTGEVICPHQSHHLRFEPTG